MDFVGPRLGHQVDYRARPHTVTGGDGIGLDAELLQGVGKRQWQVDGAERVVVIAAVQQIIGSVRLSARDRNGHRGRIILAAGHIAPRSGDGGAGEQDQLSGLASVERKIHDAPLIDHLRDAVGLRLHHSRVGAHLHFLR